MKADIVILGGGLSGYYCAKRLAYYGVTPVLIEKNDFGGTGLRTGCIPVKYFMDQIRRIKYRETVKGSYLTLEKMGKNESENIFFQNKKHREEISQEVEKNLIKFGATLFKGNPEFVDRNMIYVNGRYIEFKQLILATGTQPKIPFSIPNFGSKPLTFKEALELTTPPTSMIIVGGDVEGLEFASLFSEMGTKVVVLEMQSSFLPNMDEDLKEPVIQRMMSNGVVFETGVKVESANYEHGLWTVNGNNGNTYTASELLSTVEREPCLPSGLELFDLKIENNRIAVNSSYQSSIPEIYCIGDLNGELEMGHIAIQQAIKLADFLGNNKEILFVNDHLPRNMFTLPQVGGAGFQENELLYKNMVYKKSITALSETWRGFNLHEPNSFLKLLFDKEDNLIGAWTVGVEVSDYASFLGVMVKNRFNLETIMEQLWVHPTLSEAIIEASIQLK